MVADTGQRAVNPWLIAPVVALAAFMEILDIAVANVALPHIAGDLSSSQDEATWVLTSYLVTNAIVMPISGWMSGRFGRKRFFLTCITGFTLTSLLCGLAPSLGLLTVLRALQGAAGGGLQPTGQAILTDAFPPEKRSMATAVYGIATSVAPAIGPALGGWITDNYEWRWVFLINVPLGVMLVFLIAVLVRSPRDQVPQSHSHAGVDWLGFGFVALSLGCLQIVLDRGQEEDWFASGLITTLAIVSGIALVLLVWWELQHENPMVDLKLLRRRDFAAGFVLMLVFGFMLFGSTYLLPAYAQYVMDYRATEAGEIIIPGGFMVTVSFALVGRILDKVDLRYLIAFGLVMSGAAVWWMSNFYLDVSFATLALARAVAWTAMGLLFLPINALGFRNQPPEKTTYASSLINLARNFGGSIGVSVASTLVVRRLQFHQSRLVEHLQPLNPAYPGFAQHLGDVLHLNGLGTVAHVYQIAGQQAQLLSYLDAFKAFGVVFFLALPLLLLVKPGTGGARSAS